MYSNYSNFPTANNIQGYPYQYNRIYSSYGRQQIIRGQATWTNGGEVTKCGIPWSTNEYMTVAVGENTPYQCGEILKVRNLSLPGQREVLVTVVDEVTGYPPTKINLHKNAFIALGANPEAGVINVEIIPSPELEQEKWGKYLLEVIQTAYPSYSVTEYNFIRKTQLSPMQIKETYEFILQSQQETIKVQGVVTYNPNTDRVISFNINEV